MRRPRPRALFVGLLALSVLSLGVQHALYLCGASSAHGAPEANGRAEAAAHAGCHDAGAAPAAPEGDHSTPACCGTASLASLPSGRDAVAPDTLGSPLPFPATWSAVTLVAAADATLRLPARDSRTPVSRLRPHLALRKILV